MLWKKKEAKEELPSLPPLTPKLEDFRFPVPSSAFEEQPSAETPEKNSLPSFPDSAIQKGFSQTAIKEAVGEEEAETIPKIEETPKTKTLELEEWHPRELPKLNFPEQEKEEKMPSQMQMPVSMPFKLSVEKKHDVFIKIDKFYSAKRALESVKTRLKDIEETLRKIRETKMREEQELSSWEKELSSIKARVQDVSENIFEREE